MADQLRFDALGSAGNAGAVTPNLDWLAATGARLANAYSSTPTCTPARSAILTGKSPWGHGMLGYSNIAHHFPFEMPSALASGGYRAITFGKGHFGVYNRVATNTSGCSHGFETQVVYDGIGTGFDRDPTTDIEYDTYDAWFQNKYPGIDPLASGGLDWNSWRGAPYVYAEEDHPTAWVGGRAAQFIRNYSGSGDPRPFFAKVSFHRPHSPYDPPARLLNATAPSSLPPVHAGAGWDATFETWPGCGPSDADAWCGAMPLGEATVARRAYHANVRFVDEWVGHIITALNETGLLETTFILFASDHGDGQGDHFLWRKGYPYELSAHVPMLVRWPASFPAVLPRGAVLPQVAELRDIFPTFLAVAGVGVPPGHALDGLPLTCLLADPSGGSCAGGAGWRPWIDGEHDVVYNATIHWNSLTDGRTKYIFRAYYGDEQLFNLTADPYEMADVAGEARYSASLQLWRGRMVQQFEREGRGPAWVLDGRLVQRQQSIPFSPAYPDLGKPNPCALY